MSQGKTLRILQIAAPTTAGGLERVVESLAVGHHRRGHEVTVATLLFGSGEHPVVEALLSHGVRVHPIRMGSRAYMRERREIDELCRTLRPQVAHTHGYRIDVLDRGVIAGNGIPTVTTVHGVSKMGGLKGSFFEWLQRRNYRRFDAVVAVSRALQEASIRDGVSPERLHLIPNAWGGLRPGHSRAEARRLLGLDANASVVGWVGRFIHVKGGDLFLDAISRLPEPRPVAVMIGHGPERSRLEQQATELGLDDSVRFYPNISDAARYFEAFDVYVLSSRSEGLPIVLLEAMAAAVPIVATKVGGVPDAACGEEALLVSPDGLDLCRAIGEVLGDRASARVRVTNASRRLREAFSLDAFLDRYERVYRSVVVS